jgi:hypothetical protein
LSLANALLELQQCASLEEAVAMADAIVLYKIALKYTQLKMRNHFDSAALQHCKIALH